MTTKKIFVTVAIVLLAAIISVPANAQIKYGVKGGVELGTTSLGEVFDVENLTSYSIGPSVEFMMPILHMNLGLDASLLYSDSRMQVRNLRGEGTSTGSSKVSNRYIMLPINAKFKYPLLLSVLKLYVAGGVYGGYLISGDKVDFAEMNEDVKAKKFEAGINVGAGFEILKLLQIGANYKVRVTDSFSASKDEWKDPFNKHSGVWSVALGVYF